MCNYRLMPGQADMDLHFKYKAKCFEIKCLLVYWLPYSTQITLNSICINVCYSSFHRQIELFKFNTQYEVKLTNALVLPSSMNEIRQIYQDQLQ